MRQALESILAYLWGRMRVDAEQCNLHRKGQERFASLSLVARLTIDQGKGECPAVT